MFQDLQIKRTAIVVGVMAVIALGSYSYSTLKSVRHQDPYGPSSFTVVGKGEVFAKHDVATFSFTVSAKEADAAEAQKKVSETLAGITGYLNESSVEEKDITTTSYTLSPWYEYPVPTPCLGGFCPPSGEPKLRGYEVNQSVTVKVRDMSKAGEVLAQVGGKGAMNVSGLSFTIDDREALEAQAREKAIAQAKEEAETLAKNLGVRIKKISGYWENEQGGYPEPYYDYGYEGMMAKDSFSGAVTLPQGETTITSVVNVTYEFKSRGR